MTTPHERYIVPVFTSISEQGTVDYDAIPSYADYVISQQATTVFICGTNGEGPSLTTTERKQILQHWAPYRDRLELIVHVGCQSVEETRDLASHAKATGAHGVASLLPSYLFPESYDAAVDFLAAVAAACAPLPFYYYHFPSRTRLVLSFSGLLRRCQQRIPNFKGAKFTDVDVREVQRGLALGLDVWMGYSSLSLVGAVVGSAGYFAHSSMIKLVREGLDRYREGKVDEARKVFEKVLAIEEAVGAYPLIAGAKVMEKKHHSVGGSVRAPLRSLTVDEEKTLLASLANIL